MRSVKDTAVVRIMDCTRKFSVVESCIIQLIIYVSTSFLFIHRLHVSTHQSVIFRPTLQTKSLVLCAHWDLCVTLEAREVYGILI